MKVVNISDKNITLLSNFLSQLGKENETFRYYQTRDISVIKNHVVTCILEDDYGRSVGYGHIDFDGMRYWLGVVVLKEFQGKHYGRKIVDYLIDYCNKKSIRIISLTVDNTNTVAKSLYKSVGFVITKEDKAKTEMERR